MKNAWKYAKKGLAVAALLYLGGSFINGLSIGTDSFASGYETARGIAAMVLTGLGFGLPAIVYDTELPTWAQKLIHMSVGCTVLVGAGLLAGRLRPERGLVPFLVTLGVQLALAFSIWGYSFHRAKKLAQAMNKQLRAKQV